MTIPSDPESEGIPDIADDDSYAWDDGNHPSFDDSPPMLPTDAAVAVDDYGVTGYEGSHNEPLSAKLMREEGDISPEESETTSVPYLADEAMSNEALAQVAQDADTFGLMEPGDVDLDEPPHHVGRLLSPDEGGSFEDEEAQAIAFDTGEQEGLTPEEAAMHEVPGEDVPYE